MAISISPITESFAAEVADLDLNQPLGDEEFALIEEAFDKYSVLVFCGQELSDQSQIDFSARFGPLNLTWKRAPSLRWMRSASACDYCRCDPETLPYSNGVSRTIAALAESQ